MCSENKEKDTNNNNNNNNKKFNWSEDVFEVCEETGMMVVNIFGNLYPPITIPSSVYWLIDNFKPKQYDIFIVTYPKCGTTWMQKICVEIMKIVLSKTGENKDKNKDATIINNNNNNDDDDNKYLNIDCSNLYFDGKFSNIYYLESMINNDCYYFESYLHGTDKLYFKNNNFLRFWKSHSLYSLFPINFKNKKLVKYIFIIRDPKDVIISYYEYLKLIGSPIFKCEFNKFFQLFITGLVPGGSYWEFVNDWKNNSKNLNILWIYYEDLKKDAITQIIKIIKFLGFENIINTNDEIKQIIKNSSFFKMKQMIKNGKDNYPLNFFRKGIIGDHKNILTKQQINTLNMITKSKFHSFKDIKYFTHE